MARLKCRCDPAAACRYVSGRAGSRSRAEGRRARRCMQRPRRARRAPGMRLPRTLPLILLAAPVAGRVRREIGTANPSRSPGVDRRQRENQFGLAIARQRLAKARQTLTACAASRSNGGLRRNISLLSAVPAMTREAATESPRSCPAGPSGPPKPRAEGPRLSFEPRVRSVIRIAVSARAYRASRPPCRRAASFTRQSAMAAATTCSG